MSITIWHNPRCSKSRATLKLLEERGIQPRIRRYLDEPPSAEEIRDVARMLGQPVIGMMRIKEPLFRELGLSPDMDEDRLIEALAEHPRLIERPIVLRDGKAAIGRPPEAVLKIL